MAAIEERLVGSKRSNIISVLESVMDVNNAHWRSYVAKTDNERIDRLFGLSDRVRYYWSDPRVATALDVLAANIDGKSDPPRIDLAICRGIDPAEPDAPLSRRIIPSKVGAVASQNTAAPALPWRHL